MDSLFLTALVSFAVTSANSGSLVEFQSRILALMKELKENEWNSILWVDDFLQYLEVDKEDLPEVIHEFLGLFKEYSMEELVAEASDIRMGFFIESAPKFDNSIKTVQCTYTIQWKDGSLLDYICKPYGLQGDLQVGDMAKLGSVFLDQFLESSIQPGLDHFHTHSARTLDDKKLEELIGVMHSYVNAMPASDRSAYKNVIDRVEHRLLQRFEFEPPALDGLTYLNGKGGFKCGQKRK